MALPSKADQITAVAEFLDSERNEGRDLEDIAKDIVEGYLEALVSKIKKPAQPVRLGVLIKMPLDAKVRRVQWMDGDLLWVVTDNASYGWLGPVSDEFWKYCEEYRPKKRVKVDGKDKLVEMTDEEIAEAWDNPDWQVGVKLSQNQRQHSFEIIAVGPSCALLRNVKTGTLVSDSNTNLARYYRREVKVGEVEW